MSTQEHTGVNHALAAHPRSHENELDARELVLVRDRLSVWCHEPVREFDPSIQRHPGLLPLVRGEHAGETLLSRIL